MLILTKSVSSSLAEVYTVSQPDLNVAFEGIATIDPDAFGQAVSIGVYAKTNEPYISWRKGGGLPNTVYGYRLDDAHMWSALINVPSDAYAATTLDGATWVVDHASPPSPMTVRRVPYSQAQSDYNTVPVLTTHVLPDAVTSNHNRGLLVYEDKLCVYFHLSYDSPYASGAEYLYLVVFGPDGTVLYSKAVSYVPSAFVSTTAFGLRPHYFDLADESIYVNGVISPFLNQVYEVSIAQTDPAPSNIWNGLIDFSGNQVCYAGTNLFGTNTGDSTFLRVTIPPSTAFQNIPYAPVGPYQMFWLPDADGPGPDPEPEHPHTEGPGIRASAMTNRMRYAMAAYYLQASSEVDPSNGFSVALVTSAGVGTSNSPIIPTSTNCKVWDSISHSEVPEGNGYYAGGLVIGRDDFAWQVVEDDVKNRAMLAFAPIIWTATEGNLPAQGGARYAVFKDNSEQQNILGVFDLGADRHVTDTQEFRLVGLNFYIS